MDTSAPAVANLTSPPVLAFLLGLLATSIGGDLRLPEPIYQFLSFYLLLGIGIKGGVALSQAPAGEVIGPILVTLALGVLIPVLAFVVLRWTTRLVPVDRGAMAAHYGSTSRVTFTAAAVFLTSAGISYEGYVTTLLAVLEVPAIIVGLMLAGRHVTRSASWGESLREILTGRSILLLVGGLLLGLVTGKAGYEKVEPFFGGLFVGVLTLFLLEMGVIAAKRLRDLPKAGPGLVVFAIGFPIVSGTWGSSPDWRGAVHRWCGDPRGAHGQRLVHRGPGGRPPGPARCQPRLLPHGQPGHHVPVQPDHRNPALPGHRPGVERLRGAPCRPRPSSW